MTMRDAPMASGANGLPLYTDVPTVKTRKNVPINSAASFCTVGRGGTTLVASVGASRGPGCGGAVWVVVESMTARFVVRFAAVATVTTRPHSRKSGPSAFLPPANAVVGARTSDAPAGRRLDARGGLRCAGRRTIIRWPATTTGPVFRSPGPTTPAVRSECSPSPQGRSGRRLGPDPAPPTPARTGGATRHGQRPTRAGGGTTTPGRPARAPPVAPPPRRGADRPDPAAAADLGHEHGPRRHPEPGQRDAALPHRRRGRGADRWPAPRRDRRRGGRGPGDLLLHPAGRRLLPRESEQRGGPGGVRRRRRGQLGGRPGGASHPGGPVARRHDRREPRGTARTRGAAGGFAPRPPARPPGPAPRRDPARCRAGGRPRLRRRRH